METRILNIDLHKEEKLEKQNQQNDTESQTQF